MPWPWAVEPHAGRYRGEPGPLLPGCHGLVPWCLTLAATEQRALLLSDATGLPRGASRWLLRGRPLAHSRTIHGPRPWDSRGFSAPDDVAANRTIHGPRPWDS